MFVGPSWRRALNTRHTRLRPITRSMTYLKSSKDPHDRPHGDRNEGGSAVNRADEGFLAWTLANSARRFLDPTTYSWLCTKIGAGEQEGAILDLLGWHATSRAELPAEVADRLQDWLRGFAGSDREPALRRLVEQVQVSSRNESAAVAIKPPQRLIARRNLATSRMLRAQQGRG